MITSGPCFSGSPPTAEQPDEAFGSNVEMVGNRICLQDEQPSKTSPDQLPKFLQRGILRIDPEETRRFEKL